MKLNHIGWIILLAIGLSACTTAAQPTATSTPLPPTATVPPATATLPPPTLAPTATLPPTATTPPTPAPVPIVDGSFPVGTYKCEKGYTYTFNADGRYNEEIIARDTSGGAVIMSEPGIYTVTGDKITITAYKNLEECSPQDVGAYTWSIDGQVLSLKSLGDPCAVREYTNESCEWVKQP